MKIPKKLRIGAKRYTVSSVALLRGAKLGEITPYLNEILLAQRNKKRRYTSYEKRYAFWHEVVHGILHAMKSRKVDWRDERFVTAFSVRLETVVQQVKGKV